jgi:hypothetical protein
MSGRRLSWAPVILAALLTAVAAPAHAAQNSPKRAQAFARLPDWSGIWLSDSIDEDAGGNLNDDPIKFRRAPPYNAEWEAAWQKRKEELKTKQTRGCLIDFPITLESPQPFKLIVTPEETIYLSGDGMWRQIFTDGRPHPPKDKLWPTVTGHSIGHWEGQTLVVDTIARSPGYARFIESVAFSEAAHFHERIRMTGKDSMEDQMTIDDPVAFTHPWVLTLGYKRVTFLDRLDPYYCELDERIDFDKEGKMVIKKPADPASH